MSLGQVLEIASGTIHLDPRVDPGADSFAGNDICQQVYVERAQSRTILDATALLTPVLELTPQSYPADPPLPHFRNEFGLLLRASAAGRLGEALGGDYDSSPTSSEPRFQSALDVGVGVGGGAEGLTTHSTDGVFFVQLDAIAYDSEPYPNTACKTCLSAPIRFGWGGRVRVPFWLVPGDTLLALPLVFISRPTYLDMVVRAAEGSVWGRFERVYSGPWQTPFSFQIVLGREVGLYHSSENYFKMIELDLPLFEIRSRHEFSGRIGGDALVQVGAALEWNQLTISPEPTRDTVAYSVLARFAFDGLYYAYP